MAIISFFNNSRREAGNTLSSIALATQMAIEHNMKILLLSTSFKDETIKESFINEDKSIKKLFKNTQPKINQAGIEGLDRIIRSNKMSKDIVRDYTEVVLKDRLELLLGLGKNHEKSYEDIQEDYEKIVLLANQYYDMVIVDIDRELSEEVKKAILSHSDVIILTAIQTAKEMDYLSKIYEKEDWNIKKQNSIIVLGKYNNNTKYNVKNISRNIFRQKQLLNTIPYNNLFFEAVQEANVIDLFINLLRVKDKDENYEFIHEVKRLSEDIQNKLQELQMTRYGG